MLRSRTRLILATALLAPVLLYWGAGRAPTETPAPTLAPDVADTDFYLRDARVRQFDASGRLHQELASPELEHYPEPGRLQATRPQVTLLRDDEAGGRVRISALEGEMLDSNERIDLSGDVRVFDEPDSGTSLQLETTRLKLLPEQQYAETDAPVRIISEQGETAARGMKAYFNERKVELLSEVEGRYESN